MCKWTPLIPADSLSSGGPGRPGGTIQPGRIVDRRVQDSGYDIPAVLHVRKTI